MPNYLITAHKNPFQLKRLIDRLNTKNSKFYIHVDLKSDINEFTQVIKNDNIFFIKERVDCIWGDFSLVQSALNLIKEGINNKGHFIFLSGQDYPLCSTTKIEQFFETNKMIDFIDIKESKDFCTVKEYQKRFKKYKYNYSSKRGEYKTLSPGFTMSSVKYLLKGKLSLNNFKDVIKRKEKIEPFKMYSGSNWIALTKPTLLKILSFYQSNQLILDQYFDTTFCSDEIFFQSIIKELINQGESINYQPSITYVNWHRKNYKSLPVTFNVNDIDELNQLPNNFLFARKFDIEYDEFILDKLDKNILDN